MVELPGKKNSQSLDRVRAKAHYNFHKRLRAAEEDAKFKEKLDSGHFNFDESPLMTPDEIAANKKKGDK